MEVERERETEISQSVSEKGRPPPPLRVSGGRGGLSAAADPELALVRSAPFGRLVGRSVRFLPTLKVDYYLQTFFLRIRARRESVRSEGGTSSRKEE